jgi:hypothetical protein
VLSSFHAGDHRFESGWGYYYYYRYCGQAPGPGRAVRHRLTEESGRVRAAGARVVQAALTESFPPLTTQQRESFDKLLRKLLD